MTVWKLILTEPTCVYGLLIFSWIGAEVDLTRNIVGQKPELYHSAILVNEFIYVGKGLDRDRNARFFTGFALCGICQFFVIFDTATGRCPEIIFPRVMMPNQQHLFGP